MDDGEGKGAGKGEILAKERLARETQPIPSQPTVSYAIAFLRLEGRCTTACLWVLAAAYHGLFVTVGIHKTPNPTWIAPLQLCGVRVLSRVQFTTANISIPARCLLYHTYCDSTNYQPQSHPPPFSDRTSVNFPQLLLYM